MSSLSKILRLSLSLISFASIFIVAAAIIAFISPPQKAFAESASSFNPGRIIDDGVFTNSNSMSVSQIQTFLNSQVTNCDTNGTQTFTAPNGQIMTHAQWGAEYDSAHSTNIGAAPYVCLESYVENPSTGQNNLQNPSASISGGESSAQIIYNAAQAYNINPQVILVTIQKEQGLVTDNWPWTDEYTEAMGYNCPDSGGCSGYAGFYQQVDAAAKQYRNYLNNAYNFNYVPGNNTILYGPTEDGCSSSSVVNIENESTAALYDYTPYQPDAKVLSNTNPTGSPSGPGGAVSGDNCATYGNRNFWWYFNTWFGSSLASSNAYSFVTSSATSLNYMPGQTGSVTIVLENTGLSTWYSDSNLPAGEPSTRLAAAGYQNSPFIVSDANSLYTQNQVLMTPNTVAPGQDATFTFDVKDPPMVGTDSINLVPEVGGIFLNNDGIDVVLNGKPPAWQLISSSIGTQNPLPNQGTEAQFVIQNNSGNTWYSDNNLPAGQQPTRLATIGYQNSRFADGSDPNWLGTANQIVMTPNTVAPEQDATFTAYFIGPISSSAVSSNFHFDIEEDGIFGQDNGCNFNLSTPAAKLSYEFVGSTSSPSLTTMTPGEVAQESVTLENTGNVVWNDQSFDNGYHDLRLMMDDPNYRNSAFYDPSDTNWLAPSQIAKTSGTTMPGQTATFNFDWLAPSSPGYYIEPFKPVVNGTFLQDDGLAFRTTVD